MGKALILDRLSTSVEKKLLSADEVDIEIARLEEKVEIAIQEISVLKEQTAQKISEKEAEIFSAHILILQDPEFMGVVKEKIRTDLVNAESAVREVSDGLVSLFMEMDHEYMKERAADIRDVTYRVLNLLQGNAAMTLGNSEEPVILVAHDLTPSITAQLDLDIVKGFATEIGGRTSHSAIMARSMGIPAVVGLQDFTAQLTQGEPVILDGYEGIAIFNPAEEQIKLYQEKLTKDAQRQVEYQALIDQPSVTADGVRVELAANIGTPIDAKVAVQHGAEGVGLFRTEFLYMGRNQLPSEEEQVQAYKEVVERFGKDKPIVIRTLDIGGDKELPYLDLPKEMNPFLGYRAIRLCLDRQEIFRTQLRAILRVSADGNVKIMYPMIATLAELREANQILQDVKQELDREGIPYHPQIEVGIMIEIPAAAIISDQLAKEADFFSIGTNDLIQYTMAVDRMNEKVSYLYQPFNPALLRLIQTVIHAAHREGKWVGMCGEMAGNKLAIPILLGMGLDEFSMSASSILPIRSLLQKLKKSELEQWVDHVLQMGTAEEIRRFVESETVKIDPDFVDIFRGNQSVISAI